VAGWEVVWVAWVAWVVVLIKYVIDNS